MGKRFETKYVITESDLLALNRYIDIHSKQPKFKQYEFYALLGLGNTTIADILTGKTKAISTNTIKCLTDIFQYPADCPDDNLLNPIKLKLSVQRKRLYKYRYQHLQIELKIIKLYNDIRSLTYISLKSEHVQEVTPIDKQIIELLNSWKAELNKPFPNCSEFEGIIRPLITRLSDHINWLCSIVVIDIAKERTRLELYKDNSMAYPITA